MASGFSKGFSSGFGTTRRLYLAGGRIFLENNNRLALSSGAVLNTTLDAEVSGAKLYIADGVIFYDTRDRLLIADGVIINSDGTVEDAATVTPTLTQEGFRFRNDDGSESAATWAAVQDASVSFATGKKLRLRVLVDATGAPAASQFQLEVKKSTDPDTAYKKIQ